VTLYAGDALRIVVSATDPETTLPLNPPPVSAHVDFWAPGVDRKVTPTPTRPNVAMTYRPVTSDYVLFQDTTGFAPGKWTFRVTVIGSTYSNFEYSTFRLSV
jgi:hypothetical protein